jgi:hypothetical protein
MQEGRLLAMEAYKTAQQKTRKYKTDQFSQIKGCREAIVQRKAGRNIK